MKKILFIILVPILAHSVECTNLLSNIESMPEEVISFYQQVDYQNQDLIGDFSLLRKSISTPKKIMWTLLNNKKKSIEFNHKIKSGKNCAREIFSKIYEDDSSDFLESIHEIRIKDLEQIQNSSISIEQKAQLIAKLQKNSLYLEGLKNPLKIDNLIEMFNQIILKEKTNGINPTFGTPHSWSKEFLKTKTAKHSLFAKFPKILLALARGETSQYMITGTEPTLETWILSRPMNSIELHEMLNESYIINQGDVYLTLLTIENVLNRYWRIENRANLPITRRLTSIINTFGSDGDKFGSWYHLFGMMLYGYVEGSIPAKTIGSIETIGSHILGHFELEKQEDFINSKGGVIGGRISKLITKNQFDIQELDLSKLNSNYYLDLEENFSDRF